MSLRAGAAACELSPTGPLQLFGYPHVLRLASGVHDPLLASALYLHDGRAGALVVALDLLFLTPPHARALRGRLAAALDVAEERVFISCTHTHSAPVTAEMVAWRGDVAMPPPDPAWLARVAEQTLAAARLARERARPAQCAWGRADGRGVGGNRHDPAGPTDPCAGLLALRGESGALLALAVVYGMHPTVLHEDSPWVSSDFPHYTRLALRERFGRDLTVLYHTAPAGDQSPRYAVTAQSFAEAERLGRMLGGAVGRACDDLLAAPAVWNGAVTLDGVIRRVELTRRAMPTAAQAAARLAAQRARLESLRRDGAARPAVRTAECDLFGAEGALQLAQAAEEGGLDRLLESYRPFEVQGLRIGDGRLLGLPGEIFCELALAIKQRCPPHSYPVSLVNGELQGYIVTPAAMTAGGYEADGCVFGPEAGEALVAAVCDVAALLKESDL